MPTDRAPKGADDSIAEAQELAEALARELPRLASSETGEPRSDALNRAFRMAHSLKALAPDAGAALGELANGIEDGLDDLRHGRIAVCEPLLEALLEACDGCGELLAARGRGDGARLERRIAGPLVARLKRMRRLAPEGPAHRGGCALLEAAGLDGGLRNVLTEFEEHRLAEALGRGLGLLRVHAEFDLGRIDRELAELTRRAAVVGEVISTVPSPVGGSAERIGLDLLLASPRDPGLVAAALDVAAVQVQPLRAARPEAARDPPARADASEPAPSAQGAVHGLSRTVRVGTEKIDRLLAVAGELSTARAGLARLAERMRTGALDDARRAGAELDGEVARLERRVQELQRGVLELRRVPLERVFEKLVRMMRRLARDAGKEIEFTCSGGEVELDRRVVEALAEPLLHLLRNATDHGIESPSRRERAGKPRRGRVRLSARALGERVVLEVADDGGGLDERAIRAAAIERGLLAPEPSARLSARGLVDLIFLPGFTTARAVTALSGRGVGLDVVRANLVQLSGAIDVQSRRGEGTTFRISLPVTPAAMGG